MTGRQSSFTIDVKDSSGLPAKRVVAARRDRWLRPQANCGQTVSCNTLTAQGKAG